jgi:glycerophosphoryl diester phosphodiesterase
MKGCLVRYALLGWTGYMPQQCHRNMLLVPINYARWLWGWPHRFLQRMAKVETHVFLVGPYRGEGFTRGLDDLATIRQLPRRYGGGIWTDHIETVGPALQRSHG